MIGKAFLDTNIFVYSFDRVDPRKAKTAMQIIREHAAQGNGVISFQVVQEFFNIAFKRFPATMTPADGAGYLLTVLRPFLAVHSSIALCSAALTIRSRHQLPGTTRSLWPRLLKRTAPSCTQRTCTTERRSKA
jgi:predicted nucleic acid-binding protein